MLAPRPLSLWMYHALVRRSLDRNGALYGDAGGNLPVTPTLAGLREGGRAADQDREASAILQDVVVDAVEPLTRAQLLLGGFVAVTRLEGEEAVAEPALAGDVLRCYLLRGGLLRDRVLLEQAEPLELRLGPPAEPLEDRLAVLTELSEPFHEKHLTTSSTSLARDASHYSERVYAEHTRCSFNLRIKTKDASCGNCLFVNVPWSIVAQQSTYTIL